MQTSIVILLFAGLLALGYAAPRPGAEEKDAQLLKYENDHNGIDGYNFQFDTSNGIQRQEQAQLKQFDDENAALVVRGSYSFTGDDGQVYTVNYVADENGFQPEAPHLPK
ncbi:endocuticle structural glycoprotein ABD-5-like [Anopheles arabiensis]|uniref:AGAP005999-PA n=5 Tax=gambiae species complex TaxID=44542 RepID=Q7Q676_ANOGA|nr:endocuticle structural glycoprotein ABD-5-like [Anopheles arabiensis]XP_040223801.1 endocuticle structural glycoprotein ABD-5-like [Anopheles coluzzii]XP_041772489.1 endocuticle structural glycoprotein ABD-5-like [Anopheles merus]XP_316039.1 endocuticle structural glycoprotein ABD-5 [Anopheles gambiae]EAA11707.1 AGAP005999-PA [Anopheles gambiae str. PEST]